MPLFVGMGITKLLHACPVIEATTLPPLELKDHGEVLCMEIQGTLIAKEQGHAFTQVCNVGRGSRALFHFIGAADIECLDCIHQRPAAFVRADNVVASAALNQRIDLAVAAEANRVNERFAIGCRLEHAVLCPCITKDILGDLRIGSSRRAVRVQDSVAAARQMDCQCAVIAGTEQLAAEIDLRPRIRDALRTAFSL